ncbi:SEC59/DGK1/VTE5 family protein [Oxalobacter vibrioformis]|uniref:SEC59/DGK1/VTE5 family protein n=1 Tax=Oxalobacter vibrioformis TaxID=933080 RepID=A0A9E9LU56_9BURK|nr:diacylglycerol/polyprenol kinase family protein [Oxalobacter vibrioformis]NLC23755.1 phosphatidate cytidylyltransferase [Oxalobacter sp.]WAW09216.1 SEC59/DGK1/VTE5 family protein [Oxalobacter vibrioformis]
MAKQISYRQELLRKLIHLSSLWMVVSLGILPRSWNVCLFAVLLFGQVMIEYGYYKKWPLLVSTYGRFFSRMLRESETGETFRLSGAPYVIAAALMVALLFERTISMVALSTMLIGDTCAALIGRKFGRHKINEGTKSIEGAIAFWISSAAVLAFFVNIYSQPPAFAIMGVFGLTVAMLAEIYEKQIKMDDNFSIPLAMGISLSLARFLPVG